MSTVSLDDIKARLQERKDLLTTRLERVKRNISAEHSADWSEQAQERQNDEVLDAIGNESETELARINRALERLREGAYTTCSRCGEDIDLRRLEAVPYTDLCIDCANAE